MSECRKKLFDRTKFHKAFRLATVILLFVSIIVFVLLGTSIQYQDLKDTYALADETTLFLKSECQKYENNAQGISARSKQDLLDHALCLKRFAGDEFMESSDNLASFIHTEHVGGVLVVDSSLSPIAQADMDNCNSYSLWVDVLQKDTVRDILQHPNKSYVGDVTLQGVPYDFSVVANSDGSRLILCYSSTAKPSTDPYEITISGILINNNFHKDPTVVITDGTQILSTNDPIVAELGSTQYHFLSSTVDWKDGELTRFRYNNTTFYGLRRVYGTYYLYAVYPSKAVFTDRTNFIILAFMLYLLLCVHYLFAQRHVDKDNLASAQKQLRIINAISTSYSSTFLLHIDRMELEPIHPSARLKTLFDEHSEPYDFLFHAVQQFVVPEQRGIMMDFLEMNSIAARLKDTAYLGNEVKASSGSWYSVMLIPQRFDKEGNVQAVLVTTQDVTSIKQAQELSFTDKLTGLRNRNYMESRSEQFMRAGELPVTFIMADCNYLKRTNDTLGHEYGDLLLQRVAESIRSSLPEDSVAMRIGGDEFLILCAHCPAERAAQIVENIRQQLAQRSDDTLKLSVAFGLHTVESSESSFQDAFDHADQAMYLEKKKHHSTTTHS